MTLTPEELAAQEAAKEKEGESGLTPEETKAELARVRREAAGYRTKLKAHEDAQAAAVAEEAKKRGEFEGLYKTEAEKRTALEAEVSQFRASQQAEFDALVNELDAADKALVADDSLPLPKRLQLAKHLKAKMATGNPPHKGPTGTRAGSVSGAHGGYESDEEWAKADYKAYKAHRDGK